MRVLEEFSFTDGLKAKEDEDGSSEPSATEHIEGGPSRGSDWHNHGG